MLEMQVIRFLFTFVYQRQEEQELTVRLEGLRSAYRRHCQKGKTKSPQLVKKQHFLDVWWVLGTALSFLRL